MIPKETWQDQFTPRDLIRLQHAVVYAEQFASAGIPGHNHILLIAKLVKLLEEEIARHSAT